MDAVPMGIICILFGSVVVFGGAGFLAGYFVGRSTGRREAQQGFLVLPATPVTPLTTPPAPDSPVPPVTPSAERRDTVP